ncbi:MAG: GNAT family N-acetyltransferase [Asgard group archaeon]|nr:GNAT family N-acetyltransferase [Asgard group archaeon]
MAIKIEQGDPQKYFKEISSIVGDCFEGVWSADDLKQLIEIPHENKIFFVAYADDKPIGYAFVVADYVDELDAKIATIQEIGLLPEHRDTAIVDDLIDQAIHFSRASKAELLEQIVSSIDQWIIPNLMKKNLKPSEIKADREISSFNEAKLLLTNLRKSSKLNVLMNQVFFESNNDLESQIIENDEDFENMPRNDPIAFGSIISIDKADDLENTLEELNKLEIEWDEIGITFDYLL